MIPDDVLTWLSEKGYGEVVSTQSIGGGCINNGARLGTTYGKTFFLKTNRRTPSGMFAREAEGLQALSKPDGPRIPGVYLYGEDFILLEDIAPAPQLPDFWLILGQQLARLHTYTAPYYGFEHDNYIGSTPQPNTWTEDGYEFFKVRRLEFQAKMANRAGLLSLRETRRIAQLAQRLPDLVPDQPPSIIHGDLWSGNLITDARGQPALIDPATHYGWAEADLAMTVLFGSPPASFFRAYQEVRPLPPGFEARFPLYNLYHLLNHLNLFGRSYHSQVMSVLSRFT